MPTHKSQGHRSQDDKSKGKEVSLGDVRKEVNRQLSDVWDQIDRIKVFIEMSDDDEEPEPTPVP